MSDPSITSDCNLQRPDFHCYEQFGQCGHHDAGGACNWKLTGELIDCVNKANAGGNPSSSPAPGTPTTTSAPGVTTTSQPQAPPGQVTTAPSGPNPAPTTTNAPSSSQCYKDNVQVASNKCGHNLLALDFKTMNYDAFRALCAACVEPVLFTQAGPCAEYDQLQTAMQIECDVCLSRRNEADCGRTTQCTWRGDLDRCVLLASAVTTSPAGSNPPGSVTTAPVTTITPAPTRPSCFNHNLQAAADRCGKPLVSTNFQQLNANEFQQFCSTCLEHVLGTQPDEQCPSYDELQNSLLVECQVCNGRTQTACDSASQCTWMPGTQRCGVFRRSDLSAETDRSISGSLTASGGTITASVVTNPLTLTLIMTTALMMMLLFTVLA
jgi:hypothetical protein